MITTPILSAVMGVAGVLLLFGPQFLGIARRLLAKPAPSPSVEVHPAVPPHDDPMVYTLYSLIHMRKIVANDPKAVEAIDTVLAPAILRSEVTLDES